MRRELRQYYEDELRYLRQSGAEFAAKYPAIASGLRVETGNDPHVDRLLEGFAFLAARIHHKLDDDFPEFTQTLLSMVYPHYVRPMPSMAVVELGVDPQQAKLTAPLTVPRGTRLKTRPVNGVACQFRSCYESTIWPFEITAAEWKRPETVRPAVNARGAAAVIRMELQCRGEVTFASLGLHTLRLFLNGASELVHGTYELLLNSCSGIWVRDPAQPAAAVFLPRDRVEPVGFAAEHSMLPYPGRSFDGYRLLQEYFTLPQKFHFVDISGLEAATAGASSSLEIVFLISQFEREDRWQSLETGVDRRLFRLGCTPIVNLFYQASEPILLKQTQYQYPIVPDARRTRSLEVFSVDRVKSSTPMSSAVTYYDEFFSKRHGADRNGGKSFWHSSRRSGIVPDSRPSDVSLTLVDHSAKNRLPDAEAVTAELTCTNWTLPSQLPMGGGVSDFDLEGSGPVRRIMALVPPTPALPAPNDPVRFWNLLSHLSLNHLSLAGDQPHALQAILDLYNFNRAITFQRQIQGIRSVRSSPHFARVSSEHGVTFARGLLVEMELDEENFDGGGAFLFASVLDRFLGMYASLNSFTQLETRTRQRKEALRRWQPRAGRKTLV